MSTSSRVALLNPNIRHIDIHHHYFPPDLKKENANANIGWKTPPENLPWSPEISLRAMDAMKIDFAILSFPALSSGCISDENRLTARRRNEFAAKICGTHPHRFGFFATLPFLDDVEGCLEELAYALDELGASGVSVSSCYGEGASAKYVGDELYIPIWAELHKRKAVVFLHGSQITSMPYPHPFLGIPITEVPNETFKAAAYLVVTGRKRQFPSVKIILAHLGGSTPFLSSRVAVLSHYMGCELTPDEIMGDFKTFYYETALSTSEPNLAAMERFVSNTQILFGSDFPAVSKDIVEWYTTNLERYYSEDKEKLRAIMRDNAVELFLGVKG